jgi:hypothetical protein
VLQLQHLLERLWLSQMVVEQPAGSLQEGGVHCVANGVATPTQDVYKVAGGHNMLSSTCCYQHVVPINMAEQHRCS